MRDNTTKYVAYHRVSTKKQGNSGLGLESQQAIIKNYFNENNMMAEFTDVKSGKNYRNRPELMKALRLCHERGYKLVVAKVDRLSRNFEDALEIHVNLKWNIQSCDCPVGIDKGVLALMFQFAERERELISIRTSAALAEKRKREGDSYKAGRNTHKAKDTPEYKERMSKGFKAAQKGNKDAAREKNRKAANYAYMRREEGRKLHQIAEELNNMERVKNEQDIFYSPRKFYPQTVSRLFKYSDAEWNEHTTTE